MKYIPHIKHFLYESTENSLYLSYKDLDILDVFEIPVDYDPEKVKKEFNAKIKFSIRKRTEIVNKLKAEGIKNPSENDEVQEYERLIVIYNDVKNILTKPEYDNLRIKLGITKTESKINYYDKYSNRINRIQRFAIPKVYADPLLYFKKKYKKHINSFGYIDTGMYSKSEWLVKVFVWVLDLLRKVYATKKTSRNIPIGKFYNEILSDRTLDSTVGYTLRVELVDNTPEIVLILENFQDGNSLKVLDVILQQYLELEILSKKRNYTKYLVLTEG